VIILRNVPFEKQAQFLHDNVCVYPSSPEFDQALSEVATDGLAGCDAAGCGLDGVDLAAGLQAHRDLLQAIYADLDSVKGKDGEDRYAQLVASVAFLYVCFAFGTLVRPDGLYRVRIDKTDLQCHYKKGSCARRKRHLEQHGFSIQYLSAAGEPVSLSKASHLSIAYDGQPDLVPALKVFAESVASRAEDGSKPLYDQLGMFLKGDYEAGILQKPMARESLDPLREDVLAAVGAYRADWMELVAALRSRCGLTPSGFWNYSASPSWSVSFAAPGKRPLAIFTLGSGIVFIEFTLPVDAAERIILARSRYSEPIREEVESFHCVHCPKDCRGRSMRQVDGITLCTGRAEARRIYATLSTTQDFASIHDMLEMIC
jgi:hypothetical protein